jgi:hypothetical protein
MVSIDGHAPQERQCREDKEKGVDRKSVPQGSADLQEHDEEAPRRQEASGQQFHRGEAPPDGDAQGDEGHSRHDRPRRQAGQDARSGTPQESRQERQRESRIVEVDAGQQDDDGAEVERRGAEARQDRPAAPDGQEHHARGQGQVLGGPCLVAPEPPQSQPGNEHGDEQPGNRQGRGNETRRRQEGSHEQHGGGRLDKGKRAPGPRSAGLLFREQGQAERDACKGCQQEQRHGPLGAQRDKDDGPNDAAGCGQARERTSQGSGPEKG